MEPEEKPVYPMRINKYLALQGLSTRRGADELIEKKKVYINGRVAQLGDKVTETDKVEMKRGRTPAAPRIYVAYHKPRGVITHSPDEEKDEEDIKMLLEDAQELKGVFPIGRLDKDSNGLISLTNYGRITDRLLNPKFEHEKEYMVTTVQPLRPSFKEHMEKGVEIEDYRTKPAQVTVRGENRFSIILTEGKEYQVRRLVVAMRNEVKTLERTRVMNSELGRLPRGGWHYIEGKELATFLKSLGL